MISPKTKKVLVLGSGGLRIGQAGEFDYSGSQALKTLRQEGIHTVLVNPNIATVQTDPGMADVLYLQPLTVEIVAAIIKKERPDSILLSVGGQTALNLGLALDHAGVFKKYRVAVLGTPLQAIRMTEDRGLFKKTLACLGIKTPRGQVANSVRQAMAAARTLGFPLMIRSGYALGGLASGLVTTISELRTKAREALHHAPHILIEEYLTGWKEIEYEIVRDRNNTTIAVCNMENFDPMGIHTGDSIVVAPSQTLSNTDYHRLRTLAITIARHVGIIGECNIQFALHPKTGDYRVIEMNARLSRSSALASKATGYPLAAVATRLALGYRLHEIKNPITKTTSACFEPALDYLVVKIPRWDLTKFKNTARTIGSEMKSVGEVMAIGRSFPEALQKAVRMLNIGANGLSDYPGSITHLKKEIQKPTDRRLFALYESIRRGTTPKKLSLLTHIDPWFLQQLQHIVALEKRIKHRPLTRQLLLEAKRFGFSDHTLAILKQTTERQIRQQRLAAKILPFVKQIDTLAGEFAAETNYLYTTYHGTQHDIEPSKKQPTFVLGSGPYCIGSSVEFDWCAVNTARALRALHETTVIINSNPETVSTDFDESDRLYFEELTLERIRDIADFERAKGIIVSVGGQISNTLASPLAEFGYPILGTPAASIDQTENRKKFSTLLHSLAIDQPAWHEVTGLKKARQFVQEYGYPLIVRPSYVLSGTAMNIISNDKQLKKYLHEATIASPDRPIVVSRFITGAQEVEVDGVGNNGRVIAEAISEHIERAGVHSGDATIVLPPQRLSFSLMERIRKITWQIARTLKISGPFNLQLLIKDDDIKIIECNLRASRTLPLVSKVTNTHFLALAARVLLKKPLSKKMLTQPLRCVGVKTAQFSFQRLKGADPISGVEMASTGEVACLGRDFQSTFFLSWLATEQTISGRNILLSINNENKAWLLDPIQKLTKRGWNIFSTEGTHTFLANHGIHSKLLYKPSQRAEPNVRTKLNNKTIAVTISIPTLRAFAGADRTDGFYIRRLSIDHHIPLITDPQIAQLFLSSLLATKKQQLVPKSWQDLMPSPPPTPTAFQKKVFSVVKKIPKGTTLTYQQVAERIGQPKAARAVGNALNKNYDPTIPCHRVIRSDGATGGYNRGAENKIKILKKEKALPM